VDANTVDAHAPVSEHLDRPHRAAISGLLTHAQHLATIAISRECPRYGLLAGGGLYRGRDVLAATVPARPMDFNTISGSVLCCGDKAATLINIGHFVVIELTLTVRLKDFNAVPPSMSVSASVPSSIVMGARNFVTNGCAEYGGRVSGRVPTYRAARVASLTVRSAE